MAPVEGITRITAGDIGPLLRRNAPQRGSSTPETGGSRALIPVAPALRSEGGPAPSRCPAANFLAHLIATAQQAPQTRARRRAEPDVALASYRAAARLDAPRGRQFVRCC